MSDPKHAGGLSSAYYGPAVPPPSQTSRSIGGGAASCCCNWLFCVLFQILLFVAVVVGVIVLVLWLIFRPNALKVSVEGASLTRFDLSPSNTLLYNLSLDVSIRNPNRRIGVYYDTLEAVALYEGYRFGYDGSLPVFFQDHKNTTLIHPKFNGQQALAVQSTAETHRRQKDEGWYDVEVIMYTRVRFKAWFIKTNKYTPRFTCYLKLPATSKIVKFGRTKCDVDLF